MNTTTLGEIRIKHIKKRGIRMNRDLLSARGFEGFIPIHSIINTPCKQIPNSRGIYVIYKDTFDKIKFLKESKAGWFKNQDPTVDIEALSNKWVDGSYVLYFGKAGSLNESSSSNLRSRIKQYLDFGAGKPIGHRGGRYIWQIEGFENLLVAWLVNEELEPRQLEIEYIKEFTSHYGAKPFANINN
ncbi:hypothetical protein [Cohnella terricola]|uniref:GIY-YIG domain-containing protein n=1 Tax=Cohnella terricola TaxID=1289167 RepID=A0A559J8R3_9BACL|nr:hypothetical protein [Cohnella terricola]TVX96226.1 hypothetical protein FPZ45_21170 [Cohnella terricola]